MSVPICRTAVLLVPFKRKQIFERTINAVRMVRPTKIYLAFDAPRANAEGESEACRDMRDFVERSIDWPCDVRVDRSATNLGSSERMISAINWAFKTEERLITLEEDCVAHPTFFRYCEELLERYAEEPQIGMISGNQFAPPYWTDSPESSYSFTWLSQIWGFATWRRAWANMDASYTHWPEEKEKGMLADIFENPRDQRYWARNFDGKRNPGCWDYRWAFSRWRQRQLGIVPRVNLVSNIGFGPEATHTIDAGHRVANTALSAMSFPLRHPTKITRDRNMDTYNAQILFSAGGRRHLYLMYARRWLQRLRKR
ncbi:MAG: hemolytic protein HlpA [Synoicihabitans sp.]